MQDVSTLTSTDHYHVLDTGSPHYVALKPGLETIDMNVEGAKIRYSKPFNNSGININFAEKIDDTTFAIRTYERGVEAETLSCGTGATAVAIAMFHSNQTASKSINLNAYIGCIWVYFFCSDMRVLNSIALSYPDSIYSLISLNCKRPFCINVIVLL